MSLISEIEKVIFITKEEMQQLTSEGYSINVEDTVDQNILRVNFLANESEDALVGLSFIRGVTKGYGNIHILELLAASPSKIVKRIVSFSTLILLHQYAMEHMLRFAAERKDNQLHIYYTDDFQNIIDELVNLPDTMMGR